LPLTLLANAIKKTHRRCGVDLVLEGCRKTQPLRTINPIARAQHLLQSTVVLGVIE